MARCGSECHGASTENLRSLASAPMTRWKYSADPLPWAHGAMAPCVMDRSSSGTSSSGSTSSSVPRPVHLGQAPNGELNEKERGSTSSIASGWSLGQAIFSEKRRSRSGSSASRSTNSTTSTPPARPSAVSTESVSRRLAPASPPLATSRSTTTSMVCLTCFSSLGGSVSETTSPSTRAREKPLLWSSEKRSTYSPLRARTTGARTWNRVRSGSSSNRSTICWGDCRVIGSPQVGQCGRPARAKSSRR